MAREAHITFHEKRVNSVRFWWLILAFMTGAGAATAGTVSVHPSNRYYQDDGGRPLFLLGYYGWAAVPDGYFIDHPSRYSTMILRGAPYELNYIRISLGVNRFTSATNPQSWNNQPTPVPFAHVGGKAQDVSIKNLDKDGRAKLKEKLETKVNILMEKVTDTESVYGVSIDAATVFHCY